MRNALLLLCLLLPGPLWADQENEIAIALALAEANTTAAQQQSIVVAPEYITRQETRHRLVRQRYNCRGGQCSYRWVKQAYTVSVRVPAEAYNTTLPRYPTSPARRPWTQGGKHITWRHLLTGEHKLERFDPIWLQMLTQAEIESLHTDCHTGQVKSSFVVRIP
jgi:hypothetical protein